MTTREQTAVEVEVRIKARPETIFPFFTDPAKMVLWKGITADLDPRLNGLYRVNVTGNDVARGQFVELVPHSRVVFTWGWEGDDSEASPGSSTVEVTLTPEGHETLVRLRHYDLPSERRDSHKEGWTHFLARLVDAAEGRSAGPDSYVQREAAKD